MSSTNLMLCFPAVAGLSAGVLAMRNQADADLVYASALWTLSLLFAVLVGLGIYWLFTRNRK